MQGNHSASQTASWKTKQRILHRAHVYKSQEQEHPHLPVKELFVKSMTVMPDDVALDPAGELNPPGRGPLKLLFAAQRLLNWVRFAPQSLEMLQHKHTIKIYSPSPFCRV